MSEIAISYVCAVIDWRGECDMSRSVIEPELSAKKDPVSGDIVAESSCGRIFHIPSCIAKDGRCEVFRDGAGVSVRVTFCLPGTSDESWLKLSALHRATPVLAAYAAKSARLFSKIGERKAAAERLLENISARIYLAEVG